MLKYIAILMSSLILLSSVRDIITYVSFQQNQDYIAQYLCVNRFDSEMMCHGKCILQEYLSQNHDKEHDQDAIEAKHDQQTTYVLPSIESITDRSNVLPICQKQLLPYATKAHIFELLEDIFHPPIL